MNQTKLQEAGSIHLKRRNKSIQHLTKQVFSTKAHSDLFYRLQLCVLLTHNICYSLSFDFQSEPYQPPLEFKRYESPTKPVTQKPFRPASPTKKLCVVLSTFILFRYYFTCRTGPGDTHGCFNPINYISPNDPDFLRTTSSRHGRSRSLTTREYGSTGGTSKSGTLRQPPFRPSSPNRKGVLGTLAPFPEYISGLPIYPKHMDSI